MSAIFEFSEYLDLLFLTEFWHKENDRLLLIQIPGFGILDLAEAAALLRFTTCSSIQALCLILSFHHLNVWRWVFLLLLLQSSLQCTNHLRLSHMQCLCQILLFISKCWPWSSTEFLLWLIYSWTKVTTMAKKYLLLLDCFNELVTGLTYWKGHTLELVITNGSFVSQLTSVDIGLSDHSAVFFNLELHHSCVPTIQSVTFQKCC